MKQLLKRFLSPSQIASLREYRTFALDMYSYKSYSQEGEDMILRRLFEEKRDGFYVDVGAHHPRRFSNTYHFYKRGWRGINIDAMPGSMKLFSRWRPRDINLEMAIGKNDQETQFFVFNDPAISSFDQELAQSRAKGAYHIVAKRKLRMRTLSDVLESFLPKGQQIDFLTVDVEGLDLDVLESNDWQLYRPTYVLAECWGANIDEIRQNSTYCYLAEQGYEFVAKTVATLIFGPTAIGEMQHLDSWRSPKNTW